MASEDNFRIKIKGKGFHASSPHMGIDPLVTASRIILALQTVVSRNASPLMLLLSPVLNFSQTAHTMQFHLT